MSVEVSPYARSKYNEVRPVNRAAAGSGAIRGSTIIEASPYSSLVTDEISESGTTQTAADSYSIRIRPAQRQPVAGLISQRLTAKTLRRLNGFLIEDEGEEYKVALVENGNSVFYYLPSSPLRKAGITAPNQPFQMDEVEVELPNGRNATAYSFVALAKPSESFPDSIEMNEERQRKLNTIFKRFGKPKD